jgi:hypothetical protein
MKVKCERDWRLVIGRAKLRLSRSADEAGGVIIDVGSATYGEFL